MQDAEPVSENEGDGFLLFEYKTGIEVWSEMTRK